MTYVISIAGKSPSHRLLNDLQLGDTDATLCTTARLFQVMKLWI